MAKQFKINPEHGELTNYSLAGARDKAYEAQAAGTTVYVDEEEYIDSDGVLLPDGDGDVGVWLDPTDRSFDSRVGYLNYRHLIPADQQPAGPRIDVLGCQLSVSDALELAEKIKAQVKAAEVVAQTSPGEMFVGPDGKLYVVSETASGKGLLLWSIPLDPSVHGATFKDFSVEYNYELIASLSPVATASGHRLNGSVKGGFDNSKRVR